MSTRGAIGFVIDGKEKVTYNHFDSYPDGLGCDTLKFLRECDLNKVKEQAGTLLVVDPESKPTPEQIDHLRQYSNLGVSEQTDEDWYCLVRETQGDQQATLDSGVIIDGKDFLLNSLFCEYAYIIDLDHEMLEVYVGFQKEPHEAGRFADRRGKVNEEKSYNGETFYPVAMVAAYSIRELPGDQDFCEEVAKAAGYWEDEDE